MVGVMSMLVLKSITCIGVRKIGIVVDREGGGCEATRWEKGLLCDKKGNINSSNKTSHEIYNLLIGTWRHLQPLWCGLYPRNTH